MSRTSITPLPRLKRMALFAVLFLSGAAGLGYQMAWTRMFTTGLGHEMPAVLAVVTAFFLGLALGARLLDRAIARSRRPDRWYAFLELTIGFWAFATAGLVPSANQVALHWIGQESPVFRHWLISFAVPFVVLLPATVSMGATLPAMERWVAPLARDGRCVGAVYAVNTFGAVVGALSGAALLIPSLGYTRTVFLLGTVNLACGLAALAIGARPKQILCDSSDGEDARKPGLGLALFFTGLLGIGYEVLGVRALSQVLEGTVYTFAVTLAVYLLGTSGGAGLYQWQLRRLPFERVKLSLSVGLSTACAVGVLVLTKSQVLFEFLRKDWGDSPSAVAIAEGAIAVSVFGLPTLFMGTLFAHLTQSARLVGGGIGRAVAWNTLGCAVAPAFFGAGLLPLLGLKWAFVIVVAGYGLLLLPRPGLACAGALIPLGLAFVLPDRLQFAVAPSGSRIVWNRDGVMDSVSVVEYPDRNRSLVVNARFTMGGTGSVVAERRHAHLPLLLHPDPRRTLFLGVGTGITFAAAGAHPDLEGDGAELVPEVIEAMSFFEPYNVLPSGGARLKVHAIDARRFVRCSNASYDVIVADLFHPARDGAGTLYTLEHFQAIRRRLAQGGLFCQWLPLHQLDEPILKIIIRTFLDVFPDTDAVLLRFNVDTPVLGLIGRTKPVTYGANWFETRVREDGLKAQLKSAGFAEPLQLFGCWVAGPDALRAFVGGAALNTDDQPLVVFGAPRFHYRGDAASYGRLMTLLDLAAADRCRWVTSENSRGPGGFAERVSKFIAARNVYLRGLVLETGGNMPGAIDAYVESAKLSPDFSTGYARCLTIATQQSSTDISGARSLLKRLDHARPELPVARELIERLDRR